MYFAAIILKPETKNSFVWNKPKSVVILLLVTGSQKTKQKYDICVVYI